jgi:hypothetical protein
MSERTRNELKERFSGKRGGDRSALVRQAGRLIVFTPNASLTRREKRLPQSTGTLLTT